MALSFSNRVSTCVSEESNATSMEKPAGNLVPCERGGDEEQKEAEEGRKGAEMGDGEGRRGKTMIPIPLAQKLQMRIFDWV